MLLHETSKRFIRLCPFNADTTFKRPSVPKSLHDKLMSVRLLLRFRPTASILLPETPIGEKQQLRSRDVSDFEYPKFGPMERRTSSRATQLRMLAAMSFGELKSAPLSW